MVDASAEGKVARDVAIWVSLIQTAGNSADLLAVDFGGCFADIYDRRKLLIYINIWMLVISALLGISRWRPGDAAGAPGVHIPARDRRRAGGAGVSIRNPRTRAAGRFAACDRAELGGVEHGAGSGAGAGHADRHGRGAFAGKVQAIGASFMVNAFGIHRRDLGAGAMETRGTKAPVHPETLMSATPGGVWIHVSFAGDAGDPGSCRILYSGGCDGLAQMPIIAKKQLDGQEWTYLLLMGAVGVGAVIGVFFMPKLDKRFSTEGMVAICTVAFGLGVMGLSLCRGPSHLWLAICLLLVVGFNWVIVADEF